MGPDLSYMTPLFRTNFTLARVQLRIFEVVKNAHIFLYGCMLTSLQCDVCSSVKYSERNIFMEIRVIPT